MRPLQKQKLPKTDFVLEEHKSSRIEQIEPAVAEKWLFKKVGYNFRVQFSANRCHFHFNVFICRLFESKYDR